MKEFILLQRLSTTALSPEQNRSRTQKVMAIIQRLVTQGKFVAGPLLPGEHPAAYRFGNEGFKVSGAQARVVTPDVVIENGESLGAFTIVRVADIMEAVEIAKSLPNIDFGGSVEVRELLPPPTIDAAVAFCKESVRNDPHSIGAQDALSWAYLLADRVESALENMEQTLALEPASAQRQAWISWLRETLHARKEPADVPAETLKRYAGDYETYRITLKAGSLYYEDAASRKSNRLTPLSENTFAVDGEAWLRLRFIAGQENGAGKLVLLYMEDRQEEITRTAAQEK